MADPKKCRYKSTKAPVFPVCDQPLFVGSHDNAEEGAEKATWLQTIFPPGVERRAIGESHSQWWDDHSPHNHNISYIILGSFYILAHFTMYPLDTHTIHSI